MDVLCCILIADFLTGLIHWIEDTYGVPAWWLIGGPVIEPNILHHSDPLHFTMSSVLMRNYQPFAIAAASVLALAAAGFGSWQLALTISLASMGNEVHAWAHKRPTSSLIRLLQQMKLVISPEQHARHHRRPYDVCFCTLTNWVNPILDALRFWEGLELTIATLGIHPKRGGIERGGY